jgi:hypothetical protein
MPGSPLTRHLYTPSVPNRPNASKDFFSFFLVEWIYEWVKFEVILMVNGYVEVLTNHP